MTNPPNLPPQGVNYQSAPYQDAKDQEHLNMLSIFWKVMAGLQCLGMCFGLIYVGLGILAATTGGGRDAAPMGAVFSCVGIFIVALCGAIAYLCWMVGNALKERRRLTLCYIMAGITCLSFPLGTAL